MPNGLKYPYIKIRSKNELAKRIASKTLPYSKTSALIKNVLNNFDEYWYDSKCSQPEENKFVRSAINSPLGILLDNINQKILKPYDDLLPNFIFGGVS